MGKSPTIKDKETAIISKMYMIYPIKKRYIVRHS
jgi:sulfur relay (sulfurtransferase) DsrF/TusC family protein